jgi:outer membrane protein TolC
MPRFAQRLIVLVLLFAPQRALPQEAREPVAPPPLLTLVQAVERALLKNDRLLGARDNVEQADLGVRLARSSFRPKLVPNILGSFGQTDVSNQTYRLDLSQRFTTGTELRASTGSSTARNQLGDYYNTDTTLQLSQPLLRGRGRDAARRGLSSAEARLGDATREHTIGEQQVTVEVAGVYYRLVAQKRLVEVAERSLDRARRLLEASAAKLGVGRVSQLDVFRAQQLVAQAEGQVLDARGAVEDARDQLRTLLGEGPEFDFEVEAEIPKATGGVPAEDAVKIALERRLELRSAVEALAEGERSIAFAGNQLLPQVDVNLALTRRETAETFGSSFKVDHFRFATFFAISLPTDRTSQRIEYHNALLERDRRRRAIASLRMRIAEDARRAVRQLQRLGKALEVADSSVEFAAKEVEVADLRYQRGLSNNLDVVNAEGNLLAAESRRLAVQADLALARLGLRATLGTLDPRRDVAVEPAAP